MKATSLIGVELRCPNLEASAAFFIETLGLVESASDDGASYLRCFGEDAHHTIVLRAAPRPGLELLVATVRADNGAPPVETLSASGGHHIRLAGKRQSAPPFSGRRPVLNQPLPLRGVGIEPRRLGHVGLVVEDVAAARHWWVDQLGFALRETVEDDEGELLATLAVSAQACDVMLVRGEPRAPGSLHHVAFAVDQRDTIARAALLLAERSIPVEVGLGQHGLGQLSRLYCFEPSGNRIALVHSPLLYSSEPHPAVRWPAEARDRALMIWGAPPPASFFEVHT
ncbi:MAG TPA: VOC family protein [Solirubrobacteraceae bacterium]|nr:VOC family protein [Solirubrobacteraceae bacterium]